MVQDASTIWILPFVGVGGKPTRRYGGGRIVVVASILLAFPPRIIPSVIVFFAPPSPIAPPVRIIAPSRLCSCLGFPGYVALCSVQGSSVVQDLSLFALCQDRREIRTYSIFTVVYRYVRCEFGQVVACYLKNSKSEHVQSSNN